MRVAHFFDALDEGDAAAACSDLAPGAREALEQQESDSCANVILDQGIATDDRTPAVAVFGSSGQVKRGDQTVFLSRFDGGWRIIGAGCTAPTDADRPYDCTIEVG